MTARRAWSGMKEVGLNRAFEASGDPPGIVGANELVEMQSMEFQQRAGKTDVQTARLAVAVTGE